MADFFELSRDLILLMMSKSQDLHPSWSSTIKMEASKLCRVLLLQFQKLRNKSTFSNTREIVSLQEKKFSMEPQMAK